MPLRLFLLTILVMLGVFPARSPGQESSRQESSQKPTAQEYLAAVFRRYGQMTSYRDDGQVRLDISENGKRVQRVAPMRVAMAPQGFSLQVYDVRAQTVTVESSAELHVWFVDAESRRPDFKTLHGQVLRKEWAGTHPRRWLPSVLSDPVLAQRIASGLAGPPPQLDWLFSPKPMAGLFASKPTIRFDDRRRVDDRACRVIEVDDHQNVYRFYVDEQNYLIRRVDLPPMAIQPSSDGEPENVHLVIELKNAQFNQDALKRPWQNKLDRDRVAAPHYVAQFVPPPPPEPPRHWGRKPQPYQVVNDRQETILSSHGVPVDVSIVIPETDAESKQLAKTIDQWIQQQDEPNQKRMQLVLLRYEDRGAAIALNMSPHDNKPADRIGVVNSAGTLVWSSPIVNPAVMTSLLGVVADTLAGVDVAKRMTEHWRTLTQKYDEVTR